MVERQSIKVLLDYNYYNRAYNYNARLDQEILISF